MALHVFIFLKIFFFLICWSFADGLPKMSKATIKYSASDEENINNYKKITEVHNDGSQIILCWTDIITISNQQGKESIYREYAISFETPSNAPVNSVNNQQLCRNDTIPYMIVDRKTGKRDLYNFTTVSDCDGVVVKRYEKKLCGSGPVYIKDTVVINSNITKMQIKVTPRKQNLRAINCHIMSADLHCAKNLFQNVKVQEVSKPTNYIASPTQLETTSQEKSAYKTKNYTPLYFFTKKTDKPGVINNQSASKTLIKFVGTVAPRLNKTKHFEVNPYDTNDYEFYLNNPKNPSESERVNLKALLTNSHLPKNYVPSKHYNLPYMYNGMKNTYLTDTPEDETDVSTIEHRNTLQTNIPYHRHNNFVFTVSYIPSSTKNDPQISTDRNSELPLKALFTTENINNQRTTPLYRPFDNSNPLSKLNDYPIKEGGRSRTYPEPVRKPKFQETTTTFLTNFTNNHKPLKTALHKNRTYPKKPSQEDSTFPVLITNEDNTLLYTKSTPLQLTIKKSDKNSHDSYVHPTLLNVYSTSEKEPALNKKVHTTSLPKHPAHSKFAEWLLSTSTYENTYAPSLDHQQIEHDSPLSSTDNETKKKMKIPSNFTPKSNHRKSPQQDMDLLVTNMTSPDNEIDTIVKTTIFTKTSEYDISNKMKTTTVKTPIRFSATTDIDLQFEPVQEEQKKGENPQFFTKVQPQYFTTTETPLYIDNNKQKFPQKSFVITEDHEIPKLPEESFTKIPIRYPVATETPLYSDSKNKHVKYTKGLFVVVHKGQNLSEITSPQFTTKNLEKVALDITTQPKHQTTLDELLYVLNTKAIAATNPPLEMLLGNTKINPDTFSKSSTVKQKYNFEQVHNITAPYKPLLYFNYYNGNSDSTRKLAYPSDETITSSYTKKFKYLPYLHGHTVAAANSAKWMPGEKYFINYATLNPNIQYKYQTYNKFPMGDLSNRSLIADYPTSVYTGLEPNPPKTIWQFFPYLYDKLMGTNKNYKSDVIPNYSGQNSPTNENPNIAADTLVNDIPQSPGEIPRSDIVNTFKPSSNHYNMKLMKEFNNVSGKNQSNTFSNSRTQHVFTPLKYPDVNRNKYLLEFGDSDSPLISRKQETLNNLKLFLKNACFLKPDFSKSVYSENEGNHELLDGKTTIKPEVKILQEQDQLKSNDGRKTQLPGAIQEILKKSLSPNVLEKITNSGNINRILTIVCKLAKERYENELNKYGSMIKVPLLLEKNNENNKWGMTFTEPTTVSFKEYKSPLNINFHGRNSSSSYVPLAFDVKNAFKYRPHKFHQNLYFSTKSYRVIPLNNNKNINSERIESRGGWNKLIKTDKDEDSELSFHPLYNDTSVSKIHNEENSATTKRNTKLLKNHETQLNLHNLLDYANYSNLLISNAQVAETLSKQGRDPEPTKNLEAKAKHNCSARQYHKSGIQIINYNVSILSEKGKGVVHSRQFEDTAENQALQNLHTSTNTTSSGNMDFITVLTTLMGKMHNILEDFAKSLNSN